MANLTLWEICKELKSPKYKWVDLTHELSAETPHWYGFEPLGTNKLFDYVAPDEGDTWVQAPMRVSQYSLPGQYGTHVDVPSHFDGTGRSQEQIRVDEMVYPLVVVDRSAACAADPDFVLTEDELKAWEAEHGQIPAGAFVAFRSDWHKRPPGVFDNNDENGTPHTPGWDPEAIKWLVEERRIGAIGHETPDTDPGFVTAKEGGYPYPGEQYILLQDRIQIELMAHLDEVPPVGAVIVCAFPKLKNGTGFSARCFAVCPRD